MHFLIFLFFFIKYNFGDFYKNPHENRSLIPKGCKTCHKNHNSISKEYLKGDEEPNLCLRCHGSLKDKEKALGEGIISPISNPKSVLQSFLLPFNHPLQNGCSPCHSIHRKNDEFFEFEKCKNCHSNNPLYQKPLSFHPIFGLNEGKSNLSCTSCHTSEYQNSNFGVHGSNFKGIIFSNYEKEDGFYEDNSYNFCYTCHNKEKIFFKSSFPYHREHIEKYGTSCYTCHDSHGSINLPFLLTFEDEKRNDRIFQTKNGEKKFISLGKGKGICYLSCHNFEHNGLSYGDENFSNLKRELELKKESLQNKKREILKKP